MRTDEGGHTGRAAQASRLEDPTPGVPYGDVVDTAKVVRSVLEDHELDGVDPESFMISSVPKRFAERDPWGDMDRQIETLDSLLDLARRDEAGGLGDASWPPHFPKAEGEPARVQPSRRKQS